MHNVQTYSLATDAYKRVTPHFRVREFRCWDGSDPVFVALALAQLLEAVRVHFDAPVTINSAYRTPSHNKAQGGAARSQHLYGQAADIVVQGHSPVEVAAYAETLLPNTGGIGIYKNFVHLDVREKKSRWTSNK